MANWEREEATLTQRRPAIPESFEELDKEIDRLCGAVEELISGLQMVLIQAAPARERPTPANPPPPSDVPLVQELRQRRDKIYGIASLVQSTRARLAL